MSVALKLADDEEGYIAKSYFEAYKANFKQGVPMGLIFLVAWYAVYLDFQLFGAVKNNPVILLIIGMVSVFLVIIAMIYSFHCWQDMKIRWSARSRILWIFQENILEKH